MLTEVSSLVCLHFLQSPMDSRYLLLAEYDLVLPFRDRMQMRQIKKVYSIKTRSTVSFSSPMQHLSPLKTGHCV